MAVGASGCQQTYRADASALSIYDLRTYWRFTLKERPMARADLDDFVAFFTCGPRAKRRERAVSIATPYAGPVARDKVNLDIFWLKDDALDDPDLLPPGGSRRGDRGLERFRRWRGARAGMRL